MDEYRGETIISKEEEALQESKREWGKYISLERGNLDCEPNPTSENTNQGFFEGDRFHKLSEISEWLALEENSKFNDPNRNYVISKEKFGVMLIVSPIEGIKEGLYFKDVNWKGGEWSKANNTYEFLTLCHIFSKYVDSLRVTDED